MRSLSALATPAPTGSVTVSDDKGGTCAVASLSAGSGSCAITQSAGSGPYVVSAAYSGDASNTPATTEINVQASVSASGFATSVVGGLTASATGGTDGVDSITTGSYGSDPVEAPSIGSPGS